MAITIIFEFEIYLSGFAILFELDLRSRSQLKVIGHRRGGVCVLNVSCFEFKLRFPHVLWFDITLVIFLLMLQATFTLEIWDRSGEWQKNWSMVWWEPTRVSFLQQRFHLAVSRNPVQEEKAEGNILEIFLLYLVFFCIVLVSRLLTNAKSIHVIKSLYMGHSQKVI